MTEARTPSVGTIMWHDLTVADAESVRDFYKAVAGWDAVALDMQGYSDYLMTAPGLPEPLAGVCHARGSNAGLPPQWLMYVVVESVDRSAAECERLGGKVLSGPRAMSGGLFCLIEDPAGAICGLYQPPDAA